MPSPGRTRSFTLYSPLRRRWPQAGRINLLDDAFSVDRDRAGAAGILYTGSAFGAAIDAVAKAVRCPVLASPESAVLAMRAALG
jgi:hypothetical protein